MSTPIFYQKSKFNFKDFLSASFGYALPWTTLLLIYMCCAWPDNIDLKKIPPIDILLFNHVAHIYYEIFNQRPLSMCSQHCSNNSLNVVSQSFSIFRHLIFPHLKEPELKIITKFHSDLEMAIKVVRFSFISITQQLKPNFNFLH